MNGPETRLQALGIKLPEPPQPVAAYVPVVRTGNLLFIAGQVPFVEGALTATGPVPSVCTVEAAQAAARQCAINAMAVIDGEPGGLAAVTRVVRLGVFVCSDPDFTNQPLIANGASELMLEVFGDAGRHARAAVGSISLPLGAAVEVEVVVEVASSAAC